MDSFFGKSNVGIPLQKNFLLNFTSALGFHAQVARLASLYGALDICFQLKACILEFFKQVVNANNNPFTFCVTSEVFYYQVVYSISYRQKP